MVDPRALSVQVQTARVDAGTVNASSTVDVVVPFTQSFPDTNYTALAVPEENISTVANGAVVRQVRSKTINGCVVRISTGTQAFTPGQLFLNVCAIHD